MNTMFWRSVKRIRTSIICFYICERKETLQIIGYRNLYPKLYYSLYNVMPCYMNYHMCGSECTP